MKVAILDDWFDTLRTLPCYRRLHEHEVTVWTEHTQDVQQLADRLRDTQAVVLMSTPCSGICWIPLTKSGSGMPATSSTVLARR